VVPISHGWITRRAIARNPVAKGVRLPLKLTGRGLFLFKLRLHFQNVFL
jgi:hypothetical protein